MLDVSTVELGVPTGNGDGPRLAGSLLRQATPPDKVFAGFTAMTLTAKMMVFALCLSTGCGTGTDEVPLSGQRDSTTRNVVVGQDFSITLKTIGGDGKYGEPSVSSHAVEYLGPGEPDFITPGGPTQVFRFRALSVGRAIIEIGWFFNLPPDIAPMTQPQPPFYMTVNVR